ncbi:MAG TPA: hypothetical protein VIG47_15020 [Gemmatimonadaceae bacterium]
MAMVVSAPVIAAPSPALGKVLTSLRNLPESQFATVTHWARNGTPRPTTLGKPSFQISPEDWAELAILDLTPPDRRAVLDWLRGGGRSALRARGASDSDIGSRNPVGIRPVAAPTPNPYRLLEFGSPTLGGPPPGNIAILDGWLAVKRDGRGAHACISFKNLSSLTATRVQIELPMVDDAGAQLGDLQLDRRGTFSTGVDIHGWDSLKSWQGAIGNRGFNDNCAGVSTAVAAFPLLAARYATYRILRVEYADGTAWTPSPAPQ